MKLSLFHCFLYYVVSSFLFGDIIVVQAKCFNDKPGNRTDTGCTATSPMCFKQNGFEPTNTTVQGSVCMKCINDKFDDNVDTGCTRLTPRCVGQDGREPTQSRGGTACGPALNLCSNSVLGSGVDIGCRYYNPICVDGKTRREVGYGQSGQLCAPCINNKTNPGVDLGCTAAAPNCAMNDGTEPSLNLAGERCCPTGGCTSSCPCFGTGSLYAKIKSKTAAYTFDSCYQSNDKDSIEVHLRYGINTVALVGGAGGWWGAGACFNDFFETDEPNLLSSNSKALLTTISSAAGQMCATELRTMLKDLFSIDSVQECDYVNA